MSFVFVLPGAFHSHHAYERLIVELNRSWVKLIPNQIAYIQSINYNRQSIHANKQSFDQYIDNAISDVSHCIDNNKNDNGKNKICNWNSNNNIYIIGHSMGARLSQVIANQLYYKYNIKINGLISIAGPLAQNGDNWEKIAAKQQYYNDKRKKLETIDYIVNRPIESKSDNNDNDIDDQGPIWMKITCSNFIKYKFCNDYKNEMECNENCQWLLNRLESECMDNTSYIINYDENIINSNNIDMCFIQTILDKCVDIEIQKENCQQFNIKDIFRIESGHSPFASVSHSKELANIICNWIATRQCSNRLKSKLYASI